MLTSDKDWMYTTTRRKVWPLALKREDVDLIDIATSLSKQCRYNGHVRGFYSVAEHAWLISKALERDGYDAMTQFVGLHHDDSECYTGDIIRPLKNSLRSAGVDLKPFELQIEETISNAFMLPWPWPDVVTQYDTAILRDEKDQLKPGGDDWSAFGVPAKGLGVKIEGWQWRTAAHNFLERHDELIMEIKHG